MTRPERVPVEILPGHEGVARVVAQRIAPLEAFPVPTAMLGR